MADLIRSIILHTLVRLVIGKKGANIATILEFEGALVPLYNPRNQNWFEHFEINRGELIALSDTGMATTKLLELNLPNKIEERFEMLLAGFYS